MPAGDARTPRCDLLEQRFPDLIESLQQHLPPVIVDRKRLVETLVVVHPPPLEIHRQLVAPRGRPRQQLAHRASGSVTGSIPFWQQLP